MVFFSLFVVWAFPWKEYRVQQGEPHTSIWRPPWTLSTFVARFLSWLRTLHLDARLGYFFRMGLCRRGRVRSVLFLERFTGRRPPLPMKLNFGQAFGIGGYDGLRPIQRHSRVVIAALPNTTPMNPERTT